jgi:hypothetical protein
MANSYQRYKTLTDKELETEEVRRLDLGIYEIEWGLDNSFNWVCKEQDEKQTIARHNERIICTMALINIEYKDHFLTVDLEHAIQISNNKDGRLVKRLNGHTGKVIGLIELPNGNLLSVSLDGTIKHWDMRSYKCIATIEADVSCLDDVDFANAKTLIIKNKLDTKIWRLTGELLAELTGFTKTVEYIKWFKSDTWIVKPENENPSQWSAKGELIHQYKFSFSPRTDVLELDNLQLLIKDTHNILQLWSKDGELLEKHVKDVGITDYFDKLVTASKESESWIESHASTDDYPLTCNSFEFGDFHLKSGKKEIENQELLFKKSSGNRIIWDFFYRPIERNIKTALKENIDLARQAEEELTLQKSKTEKSIEKHRSKRKFAKFTALFFFFLAITLGGIGVVALFLTDNFDMLVKSISPIVDKMLESKNTLKHIKLLDLQIIFAIGTGALLFISLLWFIRNRRQKSKQFKNVGNLSLIEVMLTTYGNLIETIKTHRSEILNNLPSHQDNELFSGVKINKLIEQKIENEIQQAAMQECNIDQSDITYQRSDGQKSESIVLQDWSYIQENSHPRLNKQNEQAVRFDSNGQLVCAVRSIQYIFLTKEKVDVFSTYYDFIADKYIGRESNSFYYKDVSNVTRKDVHRNRFGQELTGSEITLSVTSGAKISLTLMNDESIREFSETLAENDAHSIEQDTAGGIAAVKERLAVESEELTVYYQAEIARAKEANKSELVKLLDITQQKLMSYIEDQCDIAKNYDRGDSIAKSQSKDSLVDLAYKNIRTQIESHKRSEAVLS